MENGESRAPEIELKQLVRIASEIKRRAAGHSQLERLCWARIDFPHSDRRSNGEDGSTRRDHRRRAPGSHDAGQRADDR
jgi:hypothetical protein